MDQAQLLSQLLDLAESAGIEVRRAALGGDGGGLCRLKGAAVLFVDTMADVPDRLDNTAAALAAALPLEEMYLLPELRDLLEKYR